MGMNECYLLLEAELLHFEVAMVVLQAQISLAGAYPQFLGSLPLLLNILQPVERTPSHTKVAEALSALETMLIM